MVNPFTPFIAVSAVTMVTGAVMIRWMPDKRPWIRDSHGVYKPNRRAIIGYSAFLIGLALYITACIVR